MVTTRTTTYSTRGRKPLKLYIYEDDRFAEDKQRHAIIILHNGNFATNNRSGEMHRLICEYFAENGFLSVSIDYRQGLKHVDFYPATILRTLLTGVEDVFDATGYLIQHADELRLNPGYILLSGSGEGASIALTAEHELCNGRCGHLPKDFNYACIVSNSGAMATDTRAFAWPQTPCPVLIVQGRGIGDIPTDHFYVPGLLWVGGQPLHEELNKANGKNIYLNISGIGHHALTGKQANRQDIISYLDSFVLGNIEMLTRS